MKKEYDMADACRNTYADKLPQLSQEQLVKLANGEANIVSERTFRVCENGRDEIIKETVISL